MKRILAIDFGEKRVGFAISDALRLTAQPLCVYKRTTLEKDIEYIKTLIEDYNVDKVVFGLPLNLNGTESKISELCREFANIVHEETDIKVEFYDERMTTSVVERMLIEDADLSRAKRKKIKDTLTATLILQGYLDLHQNKR